jgi:hypothetical protein
MVGEPATLESLARQQDRILAELASLRDDVNVLTAIVQRLDNNSTRLLAEIGATHSQVSRHGDRLRRLESLSAPGRRAMYTAESKPRLPPGSPCTNRGKCCTNPGFMGTLQASGDNVKGWRRQRRYDILRFAGVLGPTDDPWADQWVDDEGLEASAVRLFARSETSRAIAAQSMRRDPRCVATMTRGHPTQRSPLSSLL